MNLKPEQVHMHDVVVIGAGVAGLRAAMLLQEKGLDVVVVEARDRVGGRTLSADLHGARFDYGGQWVGPTQTRLLALASQLGMNTFPTWDTGRKVLDLNGKVLTYSGDIPRLSMAALAVLQTTIYRLNAMSRAVPGGRPQDAAKAEEWDRQTVAAWCERNIPLRDVRDMVGLTVRSILSAEPEEVSFLYFLHYVRNAGSVEPLISTKNGAQQSRFVEGAQTISLRLAERLGERVRLGFPVYDIDDAGNHVTISGPAGQVQARRAIIAVPPPMAGRIRYARPLPTSRDLLTQRMPMGYTIKCMAFYDRAFWRASGFSGESASFSGPLAFTFDNTSADGSVPCLVGFFNGRKGNEWGSQPFEARKQMFVDTLARYFGPLAYEATDYREHDWNQELWSCGCPVATSGPGTLAGYGAAMREPVGNLHWAGTETAGEWCGFIEGALESAERVAAEIPARH
jgi:monoamine oxidase